ncbi:MAG TPA: AAA family ATPase [Methanosarcina thermophila]|nr:AAA family ATPase [Methanosarcina thermophila]HOA69333.1 AAA family ATPase [Methanosarcina thermophila]HOQ65481.1 AAA family ATPase [Methanosarcina thermophila]HPT81068.1 AAA family ATPase [Methanosarcina thermophila]HPZ20489.1 AAA family ATPase [Methanosarcina thermophila]HQD94879.1 AAA family ATPase [Methanosarcina thermophila]
MKEKLLEIKSAFMEYFKEREAEINGSLLAVLSGENLLFLGPPGTAKTQLAKSICQLIEGGNFFNYLLTSFSTPEEIFGPLSLKALEEDEFRRKIDGCLPTAHIALLDEIFKASSAILNSLLTILNEHKYHNGRELVDVPLLSVFGASNELPDEDESLEALYDRFLFRYRLSYIQDEENFRDLLFRSPEDFMPAARLRISEIYEVRERSKTLPVDPDVEIIITELRKSLQLQEIAISDRRWRKVVQVLKVAACSSGCPAVDRTMVLLLQHMLWNLPEERETIHRTVFECAISGGISTEKLRQEAEDLQAAISIALKNELPVKVVCDSCGEEFRLRQEIETHHTSHPNHSYTLKTEGSSRIYPYDNLVREIDSLQEAAGKASTLTQAQREVFEKELRALADRVERVKHRLEEERELLKSLMEANIWLSTLDRNEALLLHDTRSTELSELNDLISKSQSMLGLQDRKIHPESAPVKEEGRQETGKKEVEKKEMEKIPVPDSSSTVNSFMKGISSRFKLR